MSSDAPELGRGERPASPELERVLESAARLQRLVPDATLVGGTAAAFYAGHRYSLDHDHVVSDLAASFDSVLEALEREGDFVVNRLRPGKIILGSLGGIETGIRQLVRSRPLEVTRAVLPNGAEVTVPTEAEILRIKGFLIVKRNQVRDFLDVAALSDVMGLNEAAAVTVNIDDFYRDETMPGRESPVLDQLLRQLAAPEPADASTLNRLSSYRGLTPRWRDWANVAEACGTLAAATLELVGR